MPPLDTAHALLIGIADYQHVKPLPPVKDVPDLAALLVDPDYCGYPADQVITLLDAEATQAAIRTGLATLAQRCTADSTALIYFSGHGARIASGAHAGSYLLPVDVDAQSDAQLAQTAISSAELSAALEAIPARQVLVIFDCCHAGGIGRPRDLVPLALLPGFAERDYEALASGRGRVILASSRDDELSYVLDGAQYGLFTKHLLGGLRGGVTSEDGLIRIFDLFEYLQPRVTAEHPAQHPIFKGELEQNFAVARYLNGTIGVVSRDEQGFRYDAYISYVDQGLDRDWVWDTLLPRLEQAGLRIAVDGDVDDPGVARVVNVERGMEQAKRTVVVLSDAYLADNMATFQTAMSQTMGIQEGSYRLLPVTIGPMSGKLPTRLSMLTMLDLAHPRRAEREFERLVQALRGPLPRM